MTTPPQVKITFSDRKPALWPVSSSTRGPAVSKHAINTEHERRLPSPERLAALLLLGLEWKFTPAKFRAMHRAGLDPADAVRDPFRLPQANDRFRQRIKVNSEAFSRDSMKWAREVITRADACSASILVHGDLEYPARLYDSKHPVPILYVLGDPAILSMRGRPPSLDRIGHVPPILALPANSPARLHATTYVSSPDFQQRSMRSAIPRRCRPADPRSASFPVGSTKSFRRGDDVCGSNC